MRKIYFFSFLLVFYISINAQPQVVVHDPPTPYVTSDWGTDLQVITNMPEGLHQQAAYIYF